MSQSVINEEGKPVEPPADWCELPGDAVMSNFDREIDEQIADRLREGGCWSRHAAWDFNGRVWYERGQWHESVWRYGVPIAGHSADTLRNLMAQVNEEHGWG